MIKFCQQNKTSVLEKIRSGKLDAVALSTTNFVDEIILAMHQNGILQCLEDSIIDKRADNTIIPFKLVLALAVAAKMKIKTSLTDIPFAITDHKTLAELGYSLVDTKGDLATGLMRESSLRFIIGKYNPYDLFSNYNNTVQNYIMPKLDIKPDIHILDCTKLEVQFFNSNYEESTIGRDKDGNTARGYKLSTLRGLTDNSGIIEEIRFGSISTHDLSLSEEMLKTSSMLKHGDILINDRGFLSRDMINYLKIKRGVDTYVPLREKMQAYEMAVSIAKTENNWHVHPNRKRKTQKIAFASGIGGFWESDNTDNDVELNGCVVWDTIDNDYFVFITTDTTRTAAQIIKTYELRPEIEEDYRQLKDFWKIEDFKSTKIKVIAFHIICVLFGYLFFQLYTMLPEGEKYAHKSLPIILKNYAPKNLGSLVFYVGEEFGILTLIEFAELYASCNSDIKTMMGNVMNSI